MMPLFNELVSVRTCLAAGNQVTGRGLGHMLALPVSVQYSYIHIQVCFGGNAASTQKVVVGEQPRCYHRLLH